MSVVGIGVDLVHVPSFAAQLALPGTQFERAFTPGERIDVRDRPDDPSAHLAVRWAAKEAVIKAWSASLYGRPAVASEHVHALIEVVTDAWHRPAIRLHGQVAQQLSMFDLAVSLSHDQDYAVAYVTLSSQE